MKYLSVKQLWELLGGSVSLSQLYALCESGKVPATRALGKWIVDGEAFEEMMRREMGRQEPTREAPPPTTPEPKKGGKGKIKKVQLW